MCDINIYSRCVGDERAYVCVCGVRGGQSSIKVRLLKKWKCPNPQTFISVFPDAVGILFYFVF